MRFDSVVTVKNNKTIYRDNDKCIKVFNEHYSKAEVLNEALNQAVIEETALNVPKILEVTMIEGKWTIVYEFIEGKTLAQIMEEEPENKDKYIEFLVDLQLEIHSKKSPLLNKLKDKMNRKICAAEVDATTRYALHTRLEELPKHTKVCHGDFNPSNIIITDDSKAYIVDWSHATQGNASADAAKTYLFFRLTGDIPCANTYLDLFCKKSGTPKQYVQRWIPIVAASQSVSCNKKERDILLTWVDVVDYE